VYLNKIKIDNFRGIKKLEVNFNKGMNVIVGANNASKSAIVDAIRIGLGWGKYQKDVFVHRNDFYRDRSNPEETTPTIELSFYFTSSEEEAAGFSSLHVAHEGEEGDTQDLQLHLEFNIEERAGSYYIKSKAWGGEKSQSRRIDNDQLERIHTTYLGALRDAEKDLHASKGNRLADLLAMIEPDPLKQKDLAIKLYQQLKGGDWKTLIQKARGLVNEHLVATSLRRNRTEVDLNFLEYQFREISEDLRARTPIFRTMAIDDIGQEFFSIYQNGLGDNNRIYIATLLGDLIERVEKHTKSLFVLLIEEPEAHLHPQLQNILFEYFANQVDKGLQVFLTSHSPTITAKAPLDSLIALESNNDLVSKFEMRNSTVDDKEKKHLQRFLDVTQSQLFFASSVIIVEGLAEALLLPYLAEIAEGQLGLEKGTLNLTQNGVQIVIANGTYLKPYAKLFSEEQGKDSLSGRCSVVTDGDESVSTGEVSSRAIEARELEGGQVKTFISKQTFEYELYMASDQNQIAIKDAYKVLHTRFNPSESTAEARARDLLLKLKSNSDKGKFAQELAEKIGRSDNPMAFRCPTYLVDAIKWACYVD
jgi:putative ATP-dependent endonuclease of OLD family